MVNAFLWWLAMLFLGIGFLPFTNSMFQNFQDMGWIFSKTIGLFIAAWMTWVLNVAGILPFTQMSALTVASSLCALNYIFYFALIRRRPSRSFSVEAERGAARARRLIIAEEAGLLMLLLLAMWVVGFRPEAYGTEKFMDYAFLTSLGRGEGMPFADPWYAGEAVNYYYGGQYITAWLMKLTGSEPGISYNVMRSVVTAFSFMLPFSLAFQLMYDRVNAASARRLGRLGIFSGREGAGEDAGTGETDLLRSAREAQRKMSRRGQREVRRRREQVAAYRAERFLADTPNPEEGEREAFFRENTDDGRESARTDRDAGDGNRFRAKRASRHERQRQSRGGVRNPAVPASALCGILAGMACSMCGTVHYLIYGIIRPIADPSWFYWFPDTTRYIGYDPDLPDKTIHEFPAYSSVLGDLHAHYLNILFVVTVVAVVYAWAQKQDERHPSSFPFFARELLVIGLMTGSFRWTNFWDFPIYYVVCGSVIFFVNARLYRGRILRFAAVLAAEAGVVFGAGWAAALPFTTYFSMISSEVALTYSHTLWYQFLVVWGLPFALLIWYVCTLIREQRHIRKRTGDVLGTSTKLALPDLTVLLFGLCAAGLTILPEVIYVKDIYGGDSYRANTMFKLTYQAFILFAVVMAYVLVRVLVVNSFRAFETEFRKETRRDYELADMLASADLAARRALWASSGEKDPLARALEEDEPVRSAAEELRAGAGAPAEAAPGGRGVPAGGDGGNGGTPPEISGASPENGGEEADEAGAWTKSGKGGEDHAGSSYETVRELRRKMGFGRRFRLGFAYAGIVLLILLAGYMPTSALTWFGNIFDPSLRISDDASVFVEESFPNDAGAIAWLNDNVEGQPVILEAPGDSYSAYGRVSVATGLPTVEGWYVHEWLWRNDTEELNKRRSDIDQIYTSPDAETVRKLIDKYHITYIYIGTLERERYPELQDALLQKQGSVAYSDGQTTYIMKVN